MGQVLGGIALIGAGLATSLGLSLLALKATDSPSGDAATPLRRILFHTLAWFGGLGLSGLGVFLLTRP